MCESLDCLICDFWPLARYAHVARFARLFVPQVNKVAGNFHIAPGKSFAGAHQHVHDMKVYGDTVFDLSHRIKSISFGKAFPGAVNPLDDVEKIGTKQKKK